MHGILLVKLTERKDEMGKLLSREFERNLNKHVKIGNKSLSYFTFRRRRSTGTSLPIANTHKLRRIMVQTKPISKTITSLLDLRERFNLTPTTNEQFSSEFTRDLPELSNSEIATLDQIRNRFLRHRERGYLAEGTINHLVISPLLTLAGLYDEPFFVTTAPEVELLLEDRDEILRGRIDTLIIQQQLWVLVVESKSTIAFSVALPQALTYMMGNPNPELPVYGLITNGDEFQFIKLLKIDNLQYDLSNIFSLLLPRRNQLYDIMCVLKQIRQIMLQT